MSARVGSLAWPTVIAAVVVVSACGSDVDRESSNRGAGSDTQRTTVENAFIVPRFAPGSCAIQVGDEAVLRFTATNNSSTEADRLVAVRSEVADAFRLSGDLTIEPAGSLGVGQPTSGPVGADDDAPAVALLGLRGDALPATSHDVTFEFEKQGALTVRTPIEACPTQQR